MSYHFDFLYYAMAAIAVNNLLTSGQLSLCGGFLVGIGAYSCYLIDFYYGPINMYLLILLVGIISASLCGLLFLPARVAKGDMYAFYSLAVQLIFTIFILNVWRYTGGSTGLTSNSTYNQIPSVIIAIIVILLYVVFYFSRHRLILNCIGDDAISSLSNGINVQLIRYINNVFSGFLGGISGASIFISAGHVDPSMCSIDLSIMLLIGLAVGKPGNILAIFVASALCVFVPNMLNQANIFLNVSPYIKNVILGSVLISIVLINPKGIIPRETRSYGRIK